MGWKDTLRLYSLVSGCAQRLLRQLVLEKEMHLELVLPFKPDRLSLNDNQATLAEIEK